ncbi:MAG: hypothetical protein ACXAC8_09840 [Candidatus Hodarchaeales archaeon]
MKLDSENPCPHCGNKETLTERKESDFKAVIPKDLQFDFTREAEDRSNVYYDPTPQKRYDTNITSSATKSIKKSLIAKKRISQNVPLESILPTISGVSLDPASLKVYLQLSLEYQIILNEAPNYREAVYRWNLILPDRLQHYGITVDTWEQIASKGDNDPKIQRKLTHIIKTIFET